METKPIQNITEKETPPPMLTTEKPTPSDRPSNRRRNRRRLPAW